MTAGSGSGQTFSAEQLPTDVMATAHQRQLGPHIASRKLANPFTVAGMSLVAAAVSFGLLVLFAMIGQSVEGGLYSLARFGALFACFAFVALLAYGVAALVRGAQSFHIYAGGFIHRRNGKLRVLMWPEVAELRPAIATRGDRAGKIQPYQLVSRGGSPVAVPLEIRDGRDEFIDHLVAVLRERGVAVR